ncbi:MAG: hypothetical protein HF970_09480 [ANME-2 cluster archaeon]|nr:hypothetical protein [ANME-2 cluster archaeon]
MSPACTYAELTELANAEMDSVYAASGIAYGIKDVQIFHVIDQFIYCPDNGDGDYLHFKLYAHDGLGGPVKYNFEFATAGAMTASGIITMDIATNEIAPLDDWDLSTGPSDFDTVYKVMQHTHCPLWDQDLAYSLIDFTFSDGISSYNLGEFDIGPIDLRSYGFHIAPHPGDGVDFDYSFESHIQYLSYAYIADPVTPANTKRLTFENMHFGNTFDYGIAGDDPTDPTTWKSDIGEFQIGDMFGDLTSTDPKNWHSRPAQIDAVMTNRWDNSTYYGALLLRLPMEGAIRFEKADFGGTDFGPGTIDGINIYRMDMYLIP